MDWRKHICWPVSISVLCVHRCPCTPWEASITMTLRQAGDRTQNESGWIRKVVRRHDPGPSPCPHWEIHRCGRRPPITSWLEMLPCPSVCKCYLETKETIAFCHLLPLPLSHVERALAYFLLLLHRIFITSLNDKIRPKRSAAWTALLCLVEIPFNPRPVR